ncbi:MAG: tRNA glutamyl-Q(34) synthetase GluQRS [Fimbriimonadaceae bacterium]
MARTRFAPSPTGWLHLGHAASALYASRRGEMVLRIEDIDRSRCRAEFETGIYEDLAWLGITFPTPVVRQSERWAEYECALSRLSEEGLLFPCFCTRADIKREVEGAGVAPHGPDGPVYPGTCRSLSSQERSERMAAGEAYALRLDMAESVRRFASLLWHDDVRGEQRAVPELFGDVVLARKDTPASYHLCVTVDDAAQEIGLVTRGEDLFEATHVHRLLQAVLGLPTPGYSHHRLLTGEDGKKLSKRDGAATLRAMRESGVSAAEVRAMVEVEGRRSKE